MLDIIRFGSQAEAAIIIPGAQRSGTKSPPSGGAAHIGVRPAPGGNQRSHVVKKVEPPKRSEAGCLAFQLVSSPAET